MDQARGDVGGEKEIDAYREQNDERGREERSGKWEQEEEYERGRKTESEHRY